MAFSSCFSCIKYSVFIFNFFLWLLGCALLSVGAWILMDDNAGRYVEQLATASTEDQTPVIVSYSQLTGTDPAATLAYLFISFGCIIILVAFIGCCAAIRENQCMLSTFFISIFVVFGVLLGISIWAFVKRDDVDAHTFQLRRLTNRMVRGAVRHYYSDQNSYKFMNSLQKQFRCCGADNAAADYMLSGPQQQPPCQVASQRNSCLAPYFYYVGDTFEEFMYNRLTVIAAVALGIASCMVVGMLAVILLCCALRERRWSTNA